MILLIEVNGSNITSTEEIANAFNEYFTDIGPNLANSIHDSDASFEQFVKPAQTKFSRSQLVSESKVLKLLNGLSNRKAAGLDKISGKILGYVVTLCQMTSDHSQIAGNVRGSNFQNFPGCTCPGSAIFFAGYATDFNPSKFRLYIFPKEKKQPSILHLGNELLASFEVGETTKAVVSFFGIFLPIGFRLSVCVACNFCSAKPTL